MSEVQRVEWLEVGISRSRPPERTKDELLKIKASGWTLCGRTRFDSLLFRRVRSHEENPE